MPYRQRYWRVWIIILSVFSITSLFLAVGSTVTVANETRKQNDNRHAEQARITYENCLRGNDLRTQLIDIGHATDELMETIVSSAIPRQSSDPARQPALDAFYAQLDAGFRDYNATVGQITLTDCDRLKAELA